MQASEFVFSIKEMHFSFFLFGFTSFAYAKTCCIGVLPVCFLTPKLTADFKEELTIFPLEMLVAGPNKAKDSAQLTNKNAETSKIDNFFTS
jgi:hypothetical protein